MKRFYIGSYTRLEGPGIGLCGLENGKLYFLAGSFLPNPTYVILNRAQNRLFAVCSEPVNLPDGGSVASFAVSGNKLEMLSRRDVMGSEPCHLCLSPDERYLYTANYADGSLSMLPVDNNGAIGACAQHIKHAGCSKHPERQTGPHVHHTTFIPGTNYLCAVDLGLDAVFTYVQEPETGMLTLNDRLDVLPGLGPRHLVHSKEGVAYLAHELGSAVSFLRRNADSWRVEQTLATLPEGYKNESTASAVRCTPDGKLLLVSNRGHDSIAVFSIGLDYQLVLKGIYPTGGSIPRDFDMVDNDTMLIAHQNGTVKLAALKEDGIAELDSLELNGVVCVCMATIV